MRRREPNEASEDASAAQQGTDFRVVVLVLTLLAATAHATTVTQTVDPQKLGTQDVAEVTVEISDANGSATVNLPATDDFEILGQSSSSSTRVQMGTGAGPSVQRSQRFSFSIRANRAGKLQIPAAVVNVDGHTIGGQPTPIEVTPGHVANPRPQRQDPFASIFGNSSPFGNGSPFGNQDPFDDDFFNQGRAPRAIDAQLIASVDKKKVYAGEQATVSFYLATRSQLTSVGNFRLPTIDGASSQEVDVGKRLTARPMTFDGKEYQAFLVARRALFPTHAGTLEIPEGSVDVHGKTITSQPVSLEVSAIPPGGEPGEPVGLWRISASSSGQPQVGQPLQVQIAVEGLGDLQAISSPKLDVENARVLAPSTKDLAAVSEGKAGGKRIFEFLVMPEKAGKLVVPAVQLAYFDPATGQHEHAASNPLTVEVAPAPAAAVATPVKEEEPVAPKTDSTVIPAAVILVALIFCGFLIPPLTRRIRAWAAARAGKSPSRAAFRRQASSALSQARTHAGAGRDLDAIRLAEQALFDCVRSTGLTPEALDVDALARDSSRPFLSSWAQAMLECRQARFMRLDPEKVQHILTQVARSIDEAPRHDTPSIPPGGPGVPEYFSTP